MALAESVVVTAFSAALMQAAGGVTAPAPELTFVRLKPADPEIRRLITDGYDRSASFRTLANEIQRSNAVVIIQFGQCANGRFRSCVTNVDGDGRQRNIRVKVNTRTTDDRLIATIAHELSHVVEILRDPGVVDAESALNLYRRIGTGKCREGLSEACETDAARAIEARVLDEISRVARR
jgi:hypothetical protein